MATKVGESPFQIGAVDSHAESTPPVSPRVAATAQAAQAAMPKGGPTGGHVSLSHVRATLIGPATLKLYTKEVVWGKYRYRLEAELPPGLDAEWNNIAQALAQTVLAHIPNNAPQGIPTVDLDLNPNEGITVLNSEGTPLREPFKEDIHKQIAMAFHSCAVRCPPAAPAETGTAESSTSRDNATSPPPPSTPLPIHIAPQQPPITPHATPAQRVTGTSTPDENTSRVIARKRGPPIDETDSVPAGPPPTTPRFPDASSPVPSRSSSTRSSDSDVESLSGHDSDLEDEEKITSPLTQSPTTGHN